MSKQVNTAGVMVRPPRLYLAALALGIALAWLRPLPLLPIEPMLSWILGGILIFGGVGLMVAGMGRFAAARTPVPTCQPTTALVTSGIFSWSRNPIYLGINAIYFGIALALNNGWLAIFAVPVVLVMRYGVIAREEAYLESRFSNDYLNYKKVVRRWL